MKIETDYDNFSEADLREFVNNLTELARIAGEVTVQRKEPGCVMLTLEIDKLDAARVLTAFQTGDLDSLNVVDIECEGLEEDVAAACDDVVDSAVLPTTDDSLVLSGHRQPKFPTFDYVNSDLDSPIAYADVVETALLPCADFQAKNSSLTSQWQQVFGHPFISTLSVIDNDPTVTGTAIHTASIWLREGHAVRSKNLNLFISSVFDSAEVHCSHHPEGSDRYPVELRDGRLHFYQNRMQWSKHGELFVRGYCAHLAFALLNERERDVLKFKQFPYVKTPIVDDFVELFLACLEDKPADQQAAVQAYELARGERWVASQMDSVRKLFDPAILKQRSKKLMNFQLT